MRNAGHGHSIALLFSILAGVSGCGSESTDDDDDGASGAGGQAGLPECEGFTGPIDPTSLIDDLEDGNGTLAMVSTRNGSWWVATDDTAGTITPPPNQAPPAERILGGRCESEYAMRLTGSGFTEWGATLVGGFRYTTQEDRIDASSYRGVTFWARVGDMHNSPVRLQFQDAQTNPVGGQCVDGTGSDQCYDGYGTALTPLDQEWRQYRIEFSTLTQRDFGYGGDALDTSNLYAIEWNLNANAVFDLWVDDVWFYE